MCTTRRRYLRGLKWLIWALIVSCEIHKVMAWSLMSPMKKGGLLDLSKTTRRKNNNNNNPRHCTKHLQATATAATETSIVNMETKEMAPKQQETTKSMSIREQNWLKAKGEGGLFTFPTKYGALNPYGIYYGFISIFLGLFWFVGLTACQFLYFITKEKFDPKKRLVMFFSQIWGESLMRLVAARPKFVGREGLNQFFRTKQAAMFVANHNSFLDIPFVGCTIGWRNYKFVSKAELGKVPILGKSIRMGGHVMVDRTNRKSQIMTLRHGMQLLKDGIHLCTFPEGTRSKSGRLMKFKNGAFKMAHKVGAPIIPLSIVGSGKAMPYYWMFPFRAAGSFSKVIIHEPISSTNKTEEELAAAVRAAIISGLPEDQRPLAEQQ